MVCKDKVLERHKITKLKGSPEPGYIYFRLVLIEYLKTRGIEAYYGRTKCGTQEIIVILTQTF